jgi:2-keto-3-deoxy-L-rhamnonate aldolase RhmA
VNEELLLIPMIETQQALDNLHEILSVGRIDVLLVGPSDLSIELGVPLQYASATYQAGLATIAAACKQHGVVPGMYFIPPDMAPNFFVAKGFTFFTMPWARWALAGIQHGLSGLTRD